MSDDDAPDMDALRARLQDALTAQGSAALHYVLVAGTLHGLEAQAVGERLAAFAVDELHDTLALVEKADSLGCSPAVEVERLDAPDSARDGIARLIEAERTTIKRLHAVIPETGQEEWSEALEHLLEHLIMRKQRQVDFLVRAQG